MRRVLRVVVILLLMCSCSRPAQPVRDPSHPDLRLEQVAIRSWSNDTLRVVTTASRLDVFREIGNPGDVVVHDAGVLIVRDGSQLTAPLVTGNLFSGQFEGKGGVTLSGPNQLRAVSPVVSFDRAQGTAGLASSDAGVELTRPGLRLEAASFTFDVADEHASFEQVKTEFKP
jgi:hypothetical protein